MTLMTLDKRYVPVNIFVLFLHHKKNIYYRYSMVDGNGYTFRGDNRQN